MNEFIYQGYELARSIVERAEKCCEKDHCNEAQFKDLKKAIQTFESIDKGYAERYEKEKQNERNAVPVV